jgi:hypothetical protein
VDVNFCELHLFVFARLQLVCLIANVTGLHWYIEITSSNTGLL